MRPEIKKIRVLLTKGQLDAHDRGVRTIARALMDAGMEVVFTQFRLPEEIVITALQENVDVIGISFSSGGQVRVTGEVMKLLKERGLDDKAVIIGGSIPPDDVPKLTSLGVSGVFRGGDKLEKVINHIRSCVVSKS